MLFVYVVNVVFLRLVDFWFFLKLCWIWLFVLVFIVCSILLYLLMKCYEYCFGVEFDLVFSVYVFRKNSSV